MVFRHRHTAPGGSYPGGSYSGRSTSRPAPPPPPEQPHPRRPEPGGDLALLDHCLRLLGGHRFQPRREIRYEDLLEIPVNGVIEFRRRPLSTLLMLRGQQGELLFPRVFVDDHDRSRNSFLDIKHFIREIAECAGTSAQLNWIDFQPAAGCLNRGMLRLKISDTVCEHHCDIDPGFGDPGLEAALLESVAPPGHWTANLLMGLGQQPVTLWLPEGMGEELLAALDAENRHRAWARWNG